MRRISPVAGALLALIALPLTACGSVSAAAGSLAGPTGGPRLVSVGKFDQPVYLTGAPGDTQRVFVVEKAGKIVVVVAGHRRARAFLDITGFVNSNGEEQGLLSMAFAPDYATSGRFYVDYTSANGDIHVVGYRRSGRNPDRASAGTARP